eukprot:CAMPEP_0195593900 /NCGR_PEP_ID=MMETSP0815-20121206/1134_1 /TAXON_ID=97485 /ORGANISM="Prymnesium parvum, Strain Texoma1" /LENGTH=154 /DNA_ID=CAMNT_0040733077 /DNA_START=485 /DNA_END=945 /DNA_ORIENTATION=+
MTIPGLAVCTKQPVPFSSFAKLLVSCGIAALLAPYAADCGEAPPLDPRPSMFTTHPCPCSSITRNAARHPKIVPRRLVPTTDCIVSTGVSASGAFGCCVAPALLIHRSIPPSALFASLAKESQPEGDATSHTWPTNFCPGKFATGVSAARALST